MTRRGRRVFWATVFGFVGGAAAVGYVLHRRCREREEPAAERAERLLLSCQERLRHLERQVEQAQRRSFQPASEGG